MLTAQHLSKEFSRGKTSFQALKDVSLTLEDKHFYHLVGRSGSGKSTLLKLLAGLLRPSEGSINLDGQDYAELSEDDLAALRLAKIGFVSQAKLLLGNLNVYDNIRLPYDLLNHEGDPSDRIEELMERFHIAELAREWPQTLSGGEAKRVQLARALMNQPRILLCDEPTADIDVKTTGEVMDLLQACAADCTVLVVTHELDLLRYGEQCWTMQDGCLLAGCQL